MKVKNGFTLVELIISITLLAIIGVVIAIQMNSIQQKSQTNEYDTFVEKIISAADIYITYSSELQNELETSKGYILISAADLISSGLLSSTLTNPNTGEILSSTDIIKVSLDAEGTITYEYDPDTITESYLEAQNKVLNVEDTFSCDDLSEWGTPSLRLINADGSVSTSSASSVIKNITCDVDTSVMGTYDIVYTYSIPESSKTKTLTRKVTVYNDVYETTNIATVLAGVSNSIILYGNTLTYTVTLTNNSEYQRSLDIKDLPMATAVSNGLVKLITTSLTSTQISQANSIFSTTGLNNIIVPAGSSVTYTFPLQITGNAGSKIESQITYSINDGQNATTTKQTINIEKNISVTEISKTGANIALVLDTSGSMSGSKITALKTAAKEFVNQQDLTSSEICLIKFASSASTLLCSQDASALNTKISSLSASGGTDYYSALSSAYSNLVSLNTTLSQNKDYTVFLSDGLPGSSNYSSILSSVKNISTVYSIGFETSSSASSVLKAIATDTTKYYAADTSDLDDVFASISQAINTDQIITTVEGLGSISSSMLTDKPVKFTITHSDSTVSTYSYNNVAAAITAGYITKVGSTYEIVATKFLAGDNIVFSYYITY